MDTKKKIILKKLKNHSPHILHPESTLVFKSSQEKLVIGRYEEQDDTIISLDDVSLELCVQYNFKYDTTLVEEVSEEENQPETPVEEQQDDENRPETPVEEQVDEIRPETPVEEEQLNEEQQEENLSEEKSVEEDPIDEKQQENEEKSVVFSTQDYASFERENTLFASKVSKIFSEIDERNKGMIRSISENYNSMIENKNKEIEELRQKLTDIQNKFENIKKFIG